MFKLIFDNKDEENEEIIKKESVKSIKRGENQYIINNDPNIVFPLSNRFSFQKIDNQGKYNSLISVNLDSNIFFEINGENYLTTNDGIVAVFSDKKIYIYDILLEDSNPIVFNDNSRNEEIYSSIPGSAMNFIAFRDISDNSSFFLKDIIFQSNNEYHYYSNCRYKESASEKLDKYGYFVESINTFNDKFKDIVLPGKLYFKIVSDKNIELDVINSSAYELISDGTNSKKKFLLKNKEENPMNLSDLNININFPEESSDSMANILIY